MFLIKDYTNSGSIPWIFCGMSGHGMGFIGSLPATGMGRGSLDDV